MKETEELRQYYEEQNRELIAQLATKSPKPRMEADWEKLQAQKAKHQAKLESYNYSISANLLNVSQIWSQQMR
ncbi:MAG: hypothetical protein MJA27_35775 [Pseudanabaenales cyanobacterium]|nr:hypothetical protein [Pseudanabaenales cyanobacterium]